MLRPLIFTPEQVPVVTDVELARAHPGLAVLSALCHASGSEVGAVFPALAAALRTLGPERAILYYDIVLAGLPEAPRVRWEAFMTTTVGSDFRSELLREVSAQGEARGEARGEAKALLKVLDARGVAVPADLRERILACTDLAQLDAWLSRAGTATTVGELLHG